MKDTRREWGVCGGCKVGTMSTDGKIWVEAGWACWSRDIRWE